MKSYTTFCRLVLSISAINLSPALLAAVAKIDSDLKSGKAIKRSIAQSPEWSISSSQDALGVLEKLMTENLTPAEALALSKVKSALEATQKRSSNDAAYLHAWEAIHQALEELSIEYKDSGATRSREYSSIDCCPSLRSGIIKLLLELQNELQECCKNLHDLIDKKFPCDTTKPISEVPVTIYAPGKYCVTKDLVYEGADRAITIAANNVTLDFSNHDLTLIDPAATGVYAENVREIVIKNDAIQAPAQTDSSIGIYLVNTSKATLENCLIKNTFINVFLDRCSDINISKLSAYEALGSNLLSQDSKNVVLADSVCQNSVNNLLIAGIALRQYTNIAISNSHLYNSDIFARNGVGLSVADVTNIHNDPNYIFSTLQLGSTAQEFYQAFNTTVTNSTFANIASAIDPSEEQDTITVGVVNGNSLLCDNCQFKMVYTGDKNVNSVLGFNGGPTTTNPDAFKTVFTNAQFNNCLMQAEGLTRAIVATSDALPLVSSDLIFNNCSFVGGVQKGIELAGDKNCSFLNTHHTGSQGVAFEFTNGAQYNTINNATISENNGGGVSYDATTSKNVISNSTLIANGAANIVDQGSYNVASGNISL